MDENFETLSETKYYVRSTVLGGQVLNEIDEYAAVWRTFIYAGPAVLGWLWHTYSGAFMNWDQRDPSGATVRGIGEQELDPLGADAGTFATSVPPTERALVPYHSSYNPSHPNYTYSVDGIRVPLEAGPTVGTNPFRFTIGVVGHPDEPFFPADWHPDFIGWLVRNQRQMTVENFSSLGSQWLTDYIIGPPFEENSIRQGLKKALNNPDCVKSLDSLLNAVANKNNPLLTQYTQGGIMGLFDALMSQDRLTRNAPPESAGYGSPYGTIRKGNAPIFVSGSWNQSTANQLKADVNGVLNELLHVAGQKKHYSDRQFAEVVHRDYPNLSKSVWPDDENYKFRKDARKNPNHIGWSYYFHYAVNKKCFSEIGGINVP